MVSAEGKDPITKVTYQFSSLWNLYKYIIPTRDSMSRNPMGQLTISDWRISDFLYTAEAMEQAFGFSEGILPHQRYYCQYREDEFPVFIDIYGRIIDIEDEELDEHVKLARQFPEKLYREFNRTVLSYIQQNRWHCNSVRYWL